MAGAVLSPTGFFSSTAQLQLAFEPFVDPESPVIGYDACLGSAPGATDLMAWSPLPTAALLASLRADLGVSGASQAFFSVALGAAVDPTGALSSLADAAIRSRYFSANASSSSNASGVFIYVGVRGRSSGGLSAVAFSAPLGFDLLAPTLNPKCGSDLRGCAAALGVVGAASATSSPISFVQAASQGMADQQHPEF